MSDSVGVIWLRLPDGWCISPQGDCPIYRRCNVRNGDRRGGHCPLGFGDAEVLMTTGHEASEWSRHQIILMRKEVRYGWKEDVGD